MNRYVAITLSIAQHGDITSDGSRQFLTGPAPGDASARERRFGLAPDAKQRDEDRIGAWAQRDKFAALAARSSR